MFFTNLQGTLSNKTVEWLSRCDSSCYPSLDTYFWRDWYWWDDTNKVWDHCCYWRRSIRVRDYNCSISSSTCGPLWWNGYAMALVSEKTSFAILAANQIVGRESLNVFYIDAARACL